MHRRWMTPVAVLALVASLFAGVPAQPVAAAATDPARPVVAIHVSEYTAALETMTAAPPTPTGSGNTGKEWWITAWRYFVAHQSLEEALKSDGTPFVEVSDSDIAAGKLLTTDGSARYPIVISLAAEAIADAEIAPLLGYVNAGGFLMVGSSSFTRTTAGTTRGDFALHAEMGLHMTNASLQNWTLNDRFAKTGANRLTADIPSGSLLWGGKQSSDTTPWDNNDRWVWRVASTDAEVLATGDGGVELATKGYGNGRFIYDAELQPLLGDTGYSSSDFAYTIYRHAIEWAFESAGIPIVKVSPWRYPYDAAGMVRHDLEARTSPGSFIRTSAQYEQSLGMKGDYYFTTGTLRISPTNPDTRMSDAQKKADIDNLRVAVSSYGAIVGSHNGGLPNPAGYPTPITDIAAHTLWHWGPDQALDLSPAGYPSGYAYAQQSVLTSFQDIETWMSSSPYAGATGLARVDNGRAGCGTAGTCPRTFVSPYHNAGRERSHQILSDLGAQVVGEQKVGPFPIHDFSYLTPHTYFSMVGMGVSNWYIGGTLQESIDNYLGTTDMQAAVDWYYSLGGLVNLYGHGDLRPYVSYLASKPNLWKTNAVGVRDWYLTREPVKVTPSFTRSGSTSVATATVTGSTDSQTAVELVIPNWSGTTTTGVNVKLNGAAAPAGTWRATTYGVKINVGTTVSSIEVDYHPIQSWVQTDWSGGAGQDIWSNPTRYQAATTVDTSIAGQVSLSATAGGSVLFSDTFTRQPSDPAPLSPWQSVSGSWTVANGVLSGTGASGYGNLYYVPPSSPPSDYAIDARVQLTAGSLGGGIGGRLTTTTGAHYGIWLYPPDGPAANKNHIALVEFSPNWTTYTTLSSTTFTIDANWHDLRVEFAGARIRAWVDGAQLIDYTDPSPLSGSGITVDRYPPGTISVDSVTMTTPAAFSASGSLVSSAFDAGAGSTWQALSWSAATPAGTTVRLRTRTADTATGLAAAAWSAWYAANGAPIPEPSGRWMQYQVDLGTSNPSITPFLYDVTATFAASAPLDMTPPVITVPADITVAATGPAGAVVTFTATATDNVDGALTPTCTPASGSTFPVGTTTVTCSATDSHGNSASKTFRVTVTALVDTTPPVITVPADITVAATGPAGAVVTFTATATDNVDGALTPTCTPASGSTFPVGTTTVTCSATDSHGNSASKTFRVTVTALVDTTPPVITVPADITVAATGPAGAVVTFTATATDNVDGALTPTCTPASGSTFPVGTTTVTCSATDSHGNSASKTFRVTVTALVDTTPPVITVPADITVAATGPAGAVVTFTATATDNVDGALTPTCTPASGSTFPVGTTTVTCSATDSHGNSASKTFRVTVTALVDTTPPVITVPADITVAATGPAGAVVTFTATATDNVDGALTPTCTPASGSTFPVGTTTVTCSATDSHGNSASKTFRVTVTALVDTTPPVITVPADITVAATGPAGAVVTFTATATDNVDGALTPTCTPASGSTFPVGTTTVTCSATDSHGNSASKTFRVTVTALVDTTPPTPPTSLVATATSPTRVYLTWTASTDNVRVDHYVIQRATGTRDFASVGTSTLTKFADTTVSKNTTYRYRVIAVDPTGNTSDTSGVASVTTPRRR